MKTTPFLDSAIELLEQFGQVRAKAMFGGYGMYFEDCFIAIVAGDELYFKVSDNTKQWYLDNGSHLFTYSKGNHKPTTMRYALVLPQWLDDQSQLKKLVTQAKQVARAAKR